VKGACKLSQTKDDDKKARDHNAINAQKNQLTEQNRKAGKKQFSKKTDHL